MVSMFFIKLSKIQYCLDAFSILFYFFTLIYSEWTQKKKQRSTEVEAPIILSCTNSALQKLNFAT